MSTLDDITSFLDCLGDAIIIVNDSSELIFANAACAKMFGYEVEEMPGMLLDKLMKPAAKLDHQEMVKQFIQSNSSARTMMTRGILPCVNESGEIFNARISIASVTIDNQLLGVATIQDFTSLQKEIEQLEITSHQDTLTGLYNRRYLHKVTESNSRILNTWKSIGVIYIDLNKFKPINDNYGHDVGDAVLRVVASRINGCIRFDDIVFRMGGDEFLILLNLTTAKDRARLVHNITEKIHHEVAKPIALEQATMQVGLSAGCGIYPDNESDLMRLVTKVDRAMYSAKRAGAKLVNV